jgi:hypothetical protein
VWLPDGGVLEGAAPTVGQEPAPRMQAEIEEEPLPEASAPIASNDPDFRPSPRARPESPDNGQAYDWRRMLASLFGGGEGVSAYDRQRLQEAMAQQQAKRGEADLQLRQSADRRSQEMHEAMLPKREAEAAELASKTRARDHETALADPASEQSRAALDLMTKRIEMQASRLPNGEAKTLMMQFVENVRRPGSPMSAAEAAKWARDFRVDVSDIVRDSMDAAKRKYMAAQESNLIRDDATRAAGVQTHDINIKHQAQEKLNTEINDREQAVENMKKIGDLKSNVNTGFITNLWSKWIGKPFDINSADRNQMEALLARTFNKETKELAGSAVSAAEWARIAPQIPQASDDDDVFRQKLAMAIEIAQDILKKRKQQYQLHTSGKPTDTSVTAKNAAAEGVAADGDAQAKKVARAKAILADPNESPEKKAKAERWLKAQQ